MPSEPVMRMLRVCGCSAVMVSPLRCRACFRDRFPPSFRARVFAEVFTLQPVHPAARTAHIVGSFTAGGFTHGTRRQLAADQNLSDLLRVWVDSPRFDVRSKLRFCHWQPPPAVRHFAVVENPCGHTVPSTRDRFRSTRLGIVFEVRPGVRAAEGWSVLLLAAGVPGSDVVPLSPFFGWLQSYRLQRGQATGVAIPRPFHSYPHWLHLFSPATG